MGVEKWWVYGLVRARLQVVKEVLAEVNFVFVVEDLGGGRVKRGENDLGMELVRVDQGKLEEFSVDFEKVIMSRVKSKIQELANKVGELGADPSGL